MEKASDAKVLLVLLSTDPLMPHRRPRASLLGRMTRALLIAMSLVDGNPSSVSAQT